MKFGSGGLGGCSSAGWSSWYPQNSTAVCELWQSLRQLYWTPGRRTVAVPEGGVATTLIPFAVGERALDRPVRTRTADTNWTNRPRNPRRDHPTRTSPPHRSQRGYAKYTGLVAPWHSPFDFGGEVKGPVAHTLGQSEDAPPYCIAATEPAGRGTPSETTRPELHLPTEVKGAMPNTRVLLLHGIAPLTSVGGEGPGCPHAGAE